MSEIIYLVEVTAYTGSAEETFRFCTGTGYTTTPTDTPANTFYTPRVEHPGLFRQDMFSPGKTSGNSSGGFGEIVLINTDGGLDSFVDYGFDGRRCVVMQGTADLALSEFSTVITGTIEQCEVSWNKVTMRLKDRTAELQTPFQAVFYAGDNVLPAGIEGTAELKDKPKPRLFGKCNNVTPVMVNTSKLIYQVSASVLNEISAVYDNGVSLTMAAGYTDQADMEANAPAAGEFRPWLSGGCFRLGSSAAGTITADAVQGSTAASRTAGQIIRSVAVEKLGTGQVVEQSIIALDAQAPYVVGFYTGTELVNTSEILDALCASVGAWWGFDNSGLLWSKQLTPPDAAQSLMTLTEAEIISLERTATADSDRGVPAYKINLDFSKNWTVQTSGLAGSIADNQLTFESGDGLQLTEDRRNLLGMEFIRTSATDATVQTKHILATEITVQTTIDSLADANTEAARLLALRKVRRDRLNIKISASSTKYPDEGYWDDGSIADLSKGTQSSASVLYNGVIYAFGGFVSDTGEVNWVQTLDLFKPNNKWIVNKTGSVINTTPLPGTMEQHCAALWGSKAIVAGGAFNYSYSKKCYYLDLASPLGSWVALPDLPDFCSYSAAVVYNNYLYVIGFFSDPCKIVRLNLSSPVSWDDAGVSDLPAGITSVTPLAAMYGSTCYVTGLDFKTYKMDLSTPTAGWTALPDMPTQRIGATACINNGFLYVINGQDIPVADAFKIDLSNPVNWEYIAAPHEWLYRLNSVSFNNSIYTFGGKDYSGAQYVDTWRLRNNYESTDFSQLTSLGRTVTVKYPRYGYTSGRPMVIIGAESDHSTRMLNLELWG